MKLVLNKNEVRELRKLANTIEGINGIPACRVKDLVDQTRTTKAYIFTILTGQVTIELNEEMVLEFLALTNDLAMESAPILKVVYNLGQALSPIFRKYEQKYDDLVSKYQTESHETPWSITSVSTETVEEREVC